MSQKYVTRKIVKAKGRISERELEKELGIEKVVLKELKATYVTYGVPVEKFMEMAEVIKEETR